MTAQMGDGVRAFAGSAQLAAELAGLAERVRASVVVVRGTRGGAGSGVVWRAPGLIVTNHHVAPRERAEVELAGGARVPARVIARAEGLDLAALTVEGDLTAHGAAAATVGDSTRLRPGELVVAVGNPLGERSAVALGVVGAAVGGAGVGTSRESIRVAITLRPGNSGGALADARGRVVGIPHIVVGGGMALAVPSHVVARFLRDVPGGRAYVGLSGRLVDLPPALVARYSLRSAAALLVLAVAPGGPADRAGVLLGDVLVAGGAGDAADALALLEGAIGGTLVRLPVLRGAELRCIAVRIEVLPRAA
ncbi:MAG: trypsin-like peptidase domain-containing protein [Chloroflexi bacterium]|nr:trypsin-like peptidase domain-containing protein [Chloroflexota bacterium]